MTKQELNGVISHGVFSSFRARFLSFHVAHFVFSPGVFFVFLSFRVALFRYFVFSLYVISSWRRAIKPPLPNDTTEFIHRRADTTRNVTCEVGLR